MTRHGTHPLLVVGDPAPALLLPGLDGTVADLADLRGRPFLVSFLRHAG